ncbi:MAG TPA: hypothetical protein EYN79_08775 [Planctomycetes bacterium]|nr:hypothetical protein [Planctomycetota bacterium]
MRKLMLGLAVLLVAGGFGLAVEFPTSGETEAVGMMGAVKSLFTGEEAGKGFVMTARRGPYRVSWDKKTILEVHSLKPLRTLAKETMVHLLARKQAVQPTSTGGTFPPMLIQVRAIVAGSHFKPPRLTAKLREQRLEWVSGKLRPKSGGREFEVKGYLIGKSIEAPVLIVARKGGKALEKRMRVFVAGHLDSSERKNKKIAATEVLILEPKFKEYELTHVLAHRKPPVEKKPDEDDIDF